MSICADPRRDGLGRLEVYLTLGAPVHAVSCDSVDIGMDTVQADWEVCLTLTETLGTLFSQSFPQRVHS